MEGEDDRLVSREQRIEIVIRQPVRVLARRLQLHQVDNVDYPHFQIGRGLSERRRSVHAWPLSRHKIGCHAVWDRNPTSATVTETPPSSWGESAPVAWKPF